MNPYNILLVSPFPKPYGGIASYSENLYDELKKRNINVFKFDTSRFDKYRISKSDNTRNYFRIINPLNIIFILLIFIDFFIFFISVCFKPNLIIHVHTSSFFGWWRSFVYIIIGKLLRKRCILHVHNAIDKFYIEESGQLGQFLIRKSLLFPDHIISLSNGIKDLLSNLTSKPITAVYNGVAENQFSPSKKKYNKPYQMLFAGYVGPQKGVSDLLYGLHLSGLSKDEIFFTIMGDGDIQEMKDIVKYLDIEGLVKFTGRVDEEEKTKLFNNADILALPSYGEGQPISILEGMISGAAILSSNVGSIPEIIKRENGILVNPGDKKRIAEVLNDFVKDMKIEEMGKFNYRVAKEKFTFNRVVADNVFIYENLAKKR